MAKYSVYAIGDRTKTLNDDKIKAIYFRETPTVIFFDPKKETAIDRKTGYEQYYTDMEGFWRQIYCAPTDYRPITLTYKAFKEAEAGNYYTREFNKDTKNYDYIDIKTNDKLEYNSLTTYYTPGWENY